MLDIIGTIDATIAVDPSQICARRKPGRTEATTLTVKNDGATACHLRFSHVPAVATGPNTQTGASYDITGAFDAPATVAFTTVRASRCPPRQRIVRRHDQRATRGAARPQPLRRLHRADAARRRRGVSRALCRLQGRLPVSTVVLTPTANGFPWLAQISGTSYLNRPTGGTYTLVGVGHPVLPVAPRSPVAARSSSKPSMR